MSGISTNYHISPFFYIKVENDDGIWLKLSPESVSKYCDSDTEAWTLAVGLSGRMFLAADGDFSYTSQLVDTTAKSAPEASGGGGSSKPSIFPTAASVFGTSQQQGVFGSPMPPVFQFASSKPVKLQFGSQDAPDSAGPKSGTASSSGSSSGGSGGGPFKFGSGSAAADTASKKGKGKLSDQVSRPKSPAERFGGSGPKARAHLRHFRRRRRSMSPTVDDKREDGGEEEEEEETEEKSPPESSLEEKEEDKKASLAAKPPGAKQALSPAVAECQRAIFAAFLWQENLVYDAIASATFLKFHPELTKELRQDFTNKEEEGKAAAEDRVSIEEVPSATLVELASERRDIAPPAGGEESDEATKEAKESETAGKEVENATPKDGASSGKVSSKAKITEEDELAAVNATAEDKPVLPPTLNHLVTFWDEISVKVIESSSLPFPAPKVPSLAEELLSRYELERKEIEKRKKDKDKKAPAAAGGGSTMCELCDQSFPDPVTYHMKEMHPGCSKHASGWGYNSRGTFCSGWAGNCGDGGRGGSTWYLLCKDCHARYMAMKDDVRKKMVKSVPLPKAKIRKPGKPRNLPVISAIQGMIQNAKFLLEISRPCDTSAPPTPQQKSPSITELSGLGGGCGGGGGAGGMGLGDLLRHSSTPLVESTSSMDKSYVPLRDIVGVDSTNTSSECTLTKRPPFSRSISEAVKPMDLLSQKNSVVDTADDGPPVFCQQMSEDPSGSSFSFMLKPSRNLRQLIYKRSRSSPENKDLGYRRVMAFVSSYHDLDGLRVSMKQSMRVAGVRAFAMEVSFKRDVDILKSKCLLAKCSFRRLILSKRFLFVL